MPRRQWPRCVSTLLVSLSIALPLSAIATPDTTTPDSGQLLRRRSDPRAATGRPAGIFGQSPSNPSGLSLSLLALENSGRPRVPDQLGFIENLAVGNVVEAGALPNASSSIEAMTTYGQPGSATQLLLFVVNHRLLSLSENSIAMQDLGSTRSDRVTGLSVRPNPTELWAVTYGDNKLLVYDNSSAHRFKIRASHVLEGHRLNDLAFHPDGRLFIITAEEPPQLFQVDPATGRKISSWILQGGSGMESLLWSQDGTTLYSAALRQGSKDLCTIDLSDGTVHFVNAAHSGFRNIEGLAWLVYGTSANRPAPAGDAAGPQLAQAPGRPMHLAQNVPNPFNPSTRIDFDLPREADVELSVFDITGRRVVTLLRGRAAAGPHRVEWAGRSERGERVASGTYYYTLRSGQAVQSRRMILLK